MKHLTRWHMGMMLSAYRDIPEFRDRLIEKSKMLLNFLKANDLLTSDRLQAVIGHEEDFVIMDDDLTEEGRRLFAEQHVDRWLSANDDVTKPIISRRLETGLKRIRAAV